MENQRIRLTRQLLKNALVAILQEKPIEKVTIYELCAKAQLNRTTFYKYYGSQYDVLKEIENDFFSALESNFGQQVQDDKSGLIHVLEYIRAHEKEMKVLLGALSYEKLGEKLFCHPAVHLRILDFTPNGYTERQKEYINTFYCNGGYAMIRQWLTDGMVEEPEELAELMLSFGDKLRT